MWFLVNSKKVTISVVQRHNRFFITRYTSQGQEFKTSIKHVWSQGHVIDGSATEDVLSVKRSTNKSQIIKSPSLHSC